MRCRRPFTEPSITLSPMAITAPPISSGSTATCTVTARLNLALSPATRSSICACVNSCALLMVASMVPSALAFSVSNCALISGSTDRRSFSASTLTKLAPRSPRLVPATSITRSATRSAAMAGSAFRRASCASETIAASVAIRDDQPARSFSPCAMRKTASA